MGKKRPIPAVPARPRITIVLIDDNRLVREGLAGLIREQTDFHVLAASADAAEALQKTKEAKPQVILLDFGLEGADCAEVATALMRESPEARVIVMGLSPLAENVAELVRAGVAGFMMKDTSFEMFVSTIRSVAEGAQVLPPELTSSLFGQITKAISQRGDAPKALSDIRITRREREVIDLISEGLSNKEIAARLGIAIHTVKSHVHNVLEKLSLHSRLEVAAFTRPK
ncbi:MAG: LuxR C-terminal-related transcriptional regulator [Gemmatimonadales bacterium]